MDKVVTMHEVETGGVRQEDTPAFFITLGLAIDQLMPIRPQAN